MVTGDFVTVPSPNIMGLLIITYSLSNDLDIHYNVIPRSINGGKIVTSVLGLSIGQYNVSVFLLEENGLPFSRSTTIPKNVFIMEGVFGITI